MVKISGLRKGVVPGYPIAVKLEGCKESQKAIKVHSLQCRLKGDPGAYSDRYLLEQQPHSVLWEMMIAGYITGAETGVVYIRANTRKQSVLHKKRLMIFINRNYWR